MSPRKASIFQRWKLKVVLIILNMVSALTISST